MRLCLPLEIVAAPMGISQTEVLLRARRTAEIFKSIPLLPPFAPVSSRKKSCSALLHVCNKEKPAI